MMNVITDATNNIGTMTAMRLRIYANIEVPL
jgi:hypothetical protein